MEQNQNPPEGAPVGDSATSAVAEATEQKSSVLADMLEKIGVSESQISLVRDSLKDMNVEESLEKARTYVNESLTKARDYAKKNPGVVIGGLSALVIAAGLLTASMKKDK